MATSNESGIFGEDVYVLTAAAEKELHGSETSLTPAELELLVHIDGKSTVGEIKARIRSLTGKTFTDTFEMLRRHNLIKLSTTTNALDFLDFFTTKAAPPSAVAISEATAEAPGGASTLRSQGYYVRIARRAGSARTFSKDDPISIVVIEDEPHLVKFLKQFLMLEGFSTRVATNRAEIITELSRAPRPDLVLLDVILPDADGFEVLSKMRQHPALKGVPVVMLTAQATRDAVLKGLTGGADGYVTKPFEIEVLVKAVKTVLGLPQESGTVAAAPWKPS